MFFFKTILKTMKIKEATFVHIHYSSVGKNGNEQIFEVFSTNFCMNNAGVNNLEDGVGGRYAQSWTSKEGGYSGFGRYWIRGGGGSKNWPKSLDAICLWSLRKTNCLDRRSLIS